MKTQAIVFWIVTPCNVVAQYQHFRGPCYRQKGHPKCWYSTATLHGIITTQMRSTWIRNSQFGFSCTLYICR